jgi:putative ABC transport system substrate-binding protein
VTNEPEYDHAVIGLIRRGARVLIPAGSSATAAAKHQTAIIPIIFISVGDPVGIGVVESLSHPGGNATGFTDVLADLSSKFMEFAKELVAQGMPIGYLWHEKWPAGRHRFADTERAAQAVGVTLQPRGISDIVELDGMVSEMKSNGTTIVVVQPSPFTYRHRIQIIASLTNHGLAMVCAWPPGPREGAVIGYGPDYSNIYRRAGSYISRILKGEKPSDLPVQNPIKFQLVINQNAARALGVNVPPSLIAIADDVID